jgi:hypothetical protein
MVCIMLRHLYAYDLLTDPKIEVQHSSSWAGWGGGRCTEYDYAQKERLIAVGQLGYGPFVC